MRKHKCLPIAQSQSDQGVNQDAQNRTTIQETDDNSEVKEASENTVVDAPERDAPSTAAPSTNRAAIPRSERRDWELCPPKIRGATFDRDRLQKKLTELVRDSMVSTRRPRIAAAQPLVADGSRCRATHDYYLRALPPSKKLDVDHVFECQLAAFAIVNANETHEILAQITDIRLTRTNQPFVVQNLCTPLYDVHNDFMNLRLLDKSVNVSKGAVFLDFVKELYQNGRAGEDGIIRRMSRQFRNSTWFLDLPASIDVDVLAGRIGDEMANIEDRYTDAIRGRATAAATMNAIADNVVQLYEDMDLTRSR
jgi:hypothetical protein